MDPAPRLRTDFPLGSGVLRSPGNRHRHDLFSTAPETLETVLESTAVRRFVSALDGTGLEADLGDPVTLLSIPADPSGTPTIAEFHARALSWRRLGRCGGCRQDFRPGADTSRGRPHTVRQYRTRRSRCRKARQNQLVGSGGRRTRVQNRRSGIYVRFPPGFSLGNNRPIPGTGFLGAHGTTTAPAAPARADPAPATAGPGPTAACPLPGLASRRPLPSRHLHQPPPFTRPRRSMPRPPRTRRPCRPRLETLPGPRNMPRHRPAKAIRHRPRPLFLPCRSTVRQSVRTRESPPMRLLRRLLRQLLPLLRHLQRLLLERHLWQP